MKKHNGATIEIRTNVHQIYRAGHGHSDTIMYSDNPTLACQLAKDYSGFTYIPSQNQLKTITGIHAGSWKTIIQCIRPNPDRYLMKMIGNDILTKREK
ncbi:hypothetical protein 65p348 [Aeromonas phage 65]|uniref:Uncharacterized protein n=1 Tax=Aeromonas phage 65 TaxID=2919549 RepID=E5DSI2_9CAUD|nr:hypothetical protein ST65p348 [Aeromonas phage 65]ADQ53356.1 hypothetical protein 65p348 [Aeromonas phage 65]